MTSPGNGPGRLILIINHILMAWRGFQIYEVLNQRRFKAGAFLIIPSCMNVLYFRPFLPYRAVEKRHQFQARSILRLWLATLTTRTLLSRHRSATTTFWQLTTLTWILSMLWRVKDPPKIFNPQIVTRRNNTFSLQNPSLMQNSSP